MLGGQTAKVSRTVPLRLSLFRIVKLYYEFQPIGDAELPVDVAQVILDGARADPKAACQVSDGHTVNGHLI